jgi:hypothetical protein
MGMPSGPIATTITGRRRCHADQNKTHPNGFEVAIGALDRVVQRIGG